MGKLIDLTGQKFGKLTVVELFALGAPGWAPKWKCVCECGNEKIADSKSLKRGITKDCGCGIRNRLVGKRFGRLTVLEPADRKELNKKSRKYWKCQCDCGNIAYVCTQRLCAKKSPTVSCGCYQKEIRTKHGMHGTRIYTIWKAIKGRCFGKKDGSYKNYGGRGITVCEEWLGEHGFENFYSWAMSNGYEDSLTIDRIDVNGNYEPSNCRWVTRKVQGNNTRRNHYIEIGGETKSLAEWARAYGINADAVYERIRRGWDDVKAITTPVIKNGYTRKNPAYTHAESD